MKIPLSRAFAPSLALACGLLAACRTVPAFDSRRRGELARAVIADWSEPSRLLAARTIEQYGPPDAISAGGLGWAWKGPWKRIVVWDGAAADAADGGYQQTVAYRVPEDKRAALTDFGRGVRVSQDGRELSALSSDEALNFLALNLADEIARGVRSPGEARGFYDRTAQLAAAGKSSPYLWGLRFRTPQ